MVLQISHGRFGPGRFDLAKGDMAMGDMADLAKGGIADLVKGTWPWGTWPIWPRGHIRFGQGGHGRFVQGEHGRFWPRGGYGQFNPIVITPLGANHVHYCIVIFLSGTDRLRHHDHLIFDRRHRGSCGCGVSGIWFGWGSKRKLSFHTPSPTNHVDSTNIIEDFSDDSSFILYGRPYRLSKL